jgi:hypothetical protein
MGKYDIACHCNALLVYESHEVGLLLSNNVKALALEDFSFHSLTD